MAHFTRAQVGVCGTQLGTMRLWIRCVVTLHLVRHTTHIPTLPFGPSRQLEFLFVSVGSSNVGGRTWFSSHNFNGFGPMSNFYSGGVCIIDYTFSVD